VVARENHFNKWMLRRFKFAQKDLFMRPGVHNVICGTPHTLESPMSGRVRNGALERRGSLVEQALRLEGLTAAWMLIEAAVAIRSGIAAHSLTLS
jgi:hypothetical protein